MKGAADHRKMLVIGLQWPEPQATAAGQRMCQLLQGFCNAGYQITFASAAAGEHDRTPLKAMGIETRSIKLNHSSFDQWLQRSGFDLVLFDRFITEEQFSWRVREQLPD
ncbi:MAG: glycosyltransferase, partial [Robiginitalea sp.]|nr:glycosyltransferase [Robiginitalea sp.]